MQNAHAHFSDEVPPDPLALLRIARVASVDLANATVTLDLGGVRSAPIPMASSRAGATRIWSPPSVGEQVLLACPGGDIEAAVVLAAIPQSDFPQAGDSLRELIAFDDGAVLAYDPVAQHCDIDLPAGATLEIRADGGVTISGDVSVDGIIQATGSVEAQGDVTGSGISLAGHVHPGVQSGSSTTAGPQ